MTDDRGMEQDERLDEGDGWCGFCCYDGPALTRKVESLREEVRDLTDSLATLVKKWQRGEDVYWEMKSLKEKIES